ncbi:MAG: fliL [Modestobacter sp.]|jgi:flagellar FliL protein|nr:fliL [Modestobacter sp.]
MSKKKEAPEDEDAPKGGKKKLLIIGLVAVLAIGAGAYFFLFSGGSAAAAAPEPGAVLQIDPVAINLAGGSYLKLGIALQFTADAAGHGSEPNGAKALDLAIAQFSGASLSDVQTNREAMKAALQESIVHEYHDLVMSIYYTEYVTQ